MTNVDRSRFGAWQVAHRLDRLVDLYFLDVTWSAKPHFGREITRVGPLSLGINFDSSHDVESRTREPERETATTAEEIQDGEFVRFGPHAKTTHDHLTFITSELPSQLSPSLAAARLSRN
jgi:hypothetical protein